MFSRRLFICDMFATGGESFLVNHPHFLLSAGHFANVPVCFKPRGTRDFQDYRGTLRLVIGKEVKKN